MHMGGTLEEMRRPSRPLSRGGGGAGVRHGGQPSLFDPASGRQRGNTPPIPYVMSPKAPRSTRPPSDRGTGGALRPGFSPAGQRALTPCAPSIRGA